ncbi:DUF1173 family protein [Nocardia asteroides]|uniref:DUF1173 family protein n=1 Tax=Nocardia asteroides TaxID=1824 RepID=UPI0037CB53B9
MIAMEHLTWVSLAGTRVRLAEVRADPDRFVALLAVARLGRTAKCLCQHDPLPLVVRCSSATGRHSLARLPFSRETHHPNCEFRADHTASKGNDSDADAAIAVSETGAVAVRFAEPLTSTRTQVAAAPTGRHTESNERRRVGLMGLLLHLWGAAGLNTWPSDTRRRIWADVTGALHPQLALTTISSRPAADVIYVVPPYRRDRGDHNRPGYQQFISSLRSDADQLRRGLILAEIREFQDAKFGGLRCHLAQQSRSYPGIYLTADVHDRLQRSYPTAFSRAAAAANVRKVVLMLVESSPSGKYLRAISAAVLSTNRHWIPVDSSHEAVAADALTQNRIGFVKPIRFDPGSDVVLPDFELSGCSATVLEVWGRDDPDYLQRKADKLAYYRSSGIELLEWTPPTPMPDLAAIRRF